MNRKQGWGLILIFLTAVSCKKEVHKLATSASPAERGEYLVTAFHCSACHTPHVKGSEGMEPDPDLYLSGHPEKLRVPNPPKLSKEWAWGSSATHTAFFGPWGISYSTNLTPDDVTGIGIWSEEMFIQAMRSGRHMGQSRPIAPPMPWQGLSKMSDEDLKAIYAYLRTVLPVQNQVPDFEPKHTNW